ncbi:MAG TPA: hypothetical protein IAC15_03580 [Candidatus Onthomonas avicola]|nr:hypothetical protein [Candidatus Onthomonas avicola]
MKPGKHIVRAILGLMLAAIVVYFGVYAYRVFWDSYETVTIYNYVGQSTIDAEGYIFRDETVLNAGGSLEEIVVAEGEKVAAGDTVARVYSSESALAQHEQLEQLRTELERLEYIQNHSAEQSDAMRLNEQIIEAITGLHTDVNSGDFTELEEQIRNLEDLVFRRDYTYSSGSALSEEIIALEDEIAALQSAVEGAVDTVSAPVAGTFSAAVDGYETVLTPEALTDLTPAGLRALADSQTAVSGALGKVITSTQWYYAAIVPEDVSDHISTGDTVTVNFDGSAGAQEMQVESISAADENGQVLAVFSSDRGLSATTLLREQNVEVAYATYEGLRIPARALRADQETGALGVYRLSGAQAEWVEVELLYSGRDYYLVRSVQSEDMSQLEQAELLREGDEVIVRGKGLHDGRVIS